MYKRQALIHAEDEAKQMGDEYVSVEHIFLSLLKYPNKELKAIFREFGITREGFLQALSTVRGNQRVTSDNPEATYAVSYTHLFYRTWMCGRFSDRFF